MRKWVILGIICILTITFTHTAEAGLFIGENEVHLEPFEEKTLCVGVWTGSPGTTRHTIDLSDNLDPYVTSISPTDFEIFQVDCPQDPVERRDCIRKYCNADNTNFCRKVCIEFKGPFYASFDTSVQVIEGSIRDVGYYLNAQTVVPQDITVYYRPYNLLIIVLGVAIVAVVILMVIYLKYFSTSKPFIEKNSEIFN